MRQKIIFSDIDGFLGNLISPWLMFYNKDYEDNLSIEDIKDWNIHQFVKPSCGMKIYEYIENPKIYDYVMPIDGSTWGIKKLREFGFRIVFATHSTIGHAGRKFQWLRDFGFIENHEDYIECKDKSLLRGDYLVDDYILNVKSFGRGGVLFTQPYNRQYLHTPRVNDWDEVVRFFSKEESHEQ